MKKNGKRPNRFVRFLAIFCAAALVIQLVPAGGPMSLIARATESSGVDDNSAANNDTTNNDTTNNDTTNNDTTNNDTTNNDTTNNDTTNNDTTNNDTTNNDTINNDTTNNDTTNNDTTNNDTTNNDTTNNDTTNNDTTNNDTTNNDTTNNDTTNNDTTNNDTTNNDTTNNDTTNNDTTNNDTTNNDTTNNDTTNNDTTNNDTTNNDTTNNDTTNNDTTNNDTTNNDTEDNESEQEESKLTIKNGSDEVTGSVDIKSSEVTLAADGLSGNYTYTWELDKNSTVKNAVKLTSSGNKVKLSSVKGKQGGEIKLTVTAKKNSKKGSSDSQSKSVSLKVYTEYGVESITLKKSEAGDTNKEELGDDYSAEITDTLYAEPVYTDDAIADDQDDNAYSYQWVKKDDNGDYQNIEGATELSYTPDAIGTYKLLMTRTAGEDSYRVSLSMESAEITVTKIQIEAAVTVPGKNFDNTTTIPGEDSKFSIEWSPNKNNRTDLKLLLNGIDLASSYTTDLQYDSVGSVTEDTEVGVKVVKNSPVYTMGSSDAGESFKNYEVSVKFKNATISAVVKSFDDVAAVAETPVTYKDDDGTIWVPANEDGTGTIAFKANDGYTIGIKDDKSDSFADNITVTFADNITVTFKDGNEVEFYAKNADGEIAQITMDNVKVDSAAPTVKVEDIKRISNVAHTETIVVDDTQAGVAGVYYMITENEESVTFDENTWTSIDLNNLKFTITVPNYGYVYIHSIDNVGNAFTDMKHSVIYENAAPAVSITCDNAESWTTSDSKNAITAKATDPANGSGIQSIELFLYKGNKAEGTLVKNAFRSNSTNFSNDSFIWEFNTDKLSEAERLKKAEDSLEQEVSFSVKSKSLNGEYTLKVTATDNCGNTGESTQKLVFDNSAPEVDIVLNDTKGSAVDGKWYYGAANGGLTVKFSDNLMDDTFAASSYNAVLVDDADKKLEKTLLSSSNNSGSLTFSASEIAELKEGEVYVVLEAVDAAGNKAGKDILSSADPGVLKLDTAVAEGDGWKAASFILDKTSPTASIVLTDDQGSAVDGKWYYGATNGSVAVTFTDNYMVGKGDSTLYKAYLQDSEGNTTDEKEPDTYVGDVIVEFTAEEIGKLSDGEVYVVLEAVDAAGNKAGKDILSSADPEVLKLDTALAEGDGWKAASFILDKTGPEVLITLADELGSAVDGKWYYGASSNGMTIEFTDNYMVKKGGSNTYKACLQDSDGVTKEKEPDSYTGDSVNIEFSADEIKALKNGEITVTVTAVDAAGNKADQKVLKEASPVEIKMETAVADGDGMKVASFILDTASPEVVSIETTGDQGEQSYPITDNYVYDDTNSVYYNKDVKVQIAVKDNYIRKADSYLSGSLACNPASAQPDEMIKMAGSDEGVIATYTLTGNASYSGLTISGTDYAGNPLKLKSDYEYLKNDSGKSPDELVEGAAGTVKANYGKVVDKKSPEVTITYTSDDQPNMYTGETSVEDRVSAYYNKPVSVNMQFTDNYKLDGNKLYAGTEGSETKQTSASGASYNVPVIKITEDGRSVYTAYGTDRALNPTKVTESAPDYDKNATSETYADKTAVSGAFDKDLKKQTPFAAAYEIVLDQTAPVFTLAVASPSSTNKSINSQGNRYYFNKEYTATFTVKDTNYDASKITVKKGYITSGSYNSETANVSKFPTTITSKSKVFKDTVDSDGVYRYAIYGSDKAGNALVPSSGKNLQTTSDSTSLVVDEKSNGSLEKEANISNHIVVDTVKPVGELEIKTGNTTIYKMDTKGNVTYAEPYRKETNASFKITVDSNVERTPVNIAYKVDSTNSSDKKSVSNSTYKYKNSASGKQNGKQIFQVTQYKFTDLAGNVTTYGAENKIYLDKDLPNIDKIAPTISIVAKAQSGTNGYRNGQPLFRSNVPLSIVVSDPDSTNSSSGLANVTYQMYVAGKLVSGDTKALNKANTKTHKKNYKDENLVYKISPTVTVGGKSHNNNDLEVVVTAYDNAGNKRELKYNFGIDVTDPTVKVTYDNNSAQNQKYFKANRTATIAVTERNFDPSKFKINTQGTASVSGWSHAKNGGNGDKDVWTAHVTYARDGNYTLEVSGEDLLGNKATDIKYEGTAPREFTVDKTFPSISVTYDNNDVRNDKYYKASRTATINVTDVNFNGQNDIVVRADGGGSAPSVRFSGNTATLSFPEDGIYIFNGTVTDMAGNQMEIPKQTEFVIDTKVPVLIFEDGKPFKVNKATEEGKSDHPVDMQFFTEDGFSPVVTVVDTNISTAQEDAILEIIGQKLANHFNGEAVVDANDNTKFTMGVSSLVFKVSESIDDVYHVKAQAIDLAGNESELVEFDFSINRFGSSYAADRDDKDETISPYSTYGYIRDSYYHNSTQDLTIFEYNTNALKKDSQKVEMMKDGNTATIKTLTPGTDYTFEEVPNTGNKLRTYRYTIKSSVFEEEGDYSFTISSVDEAGHENTTSRVHRGMDENGKEKLYVDSFPIDFVIDKTAPTNQLAGVKSDTKQSVNDKSLMVDVYPEDAQTAVAKVEIRRWMGDTLGLSTPDAAQDPAQTITYAYYDQETNPKPADTDTQKYEDLAAYTDESTDQIKINYEISDNQNWQWVEVITTDLAGNESTDIRAGSPDSAEGVSYSENRRGFLVTTNTFSQIVNNMAARVGAAAAIALIILFLIMRKRKKDQANAA